MTKLAFALLTFALILPQAFAAPTAVAKNPPEQAVMEYLALRQSGSSHRPAMAKIRQKFQITDEEFEKAANRVAAQGYSRDEDDSVGASPREPSSRK